MPWLLLQIEMGFTINRLETLRIETRISGFLGPLARKWGVQTPCQAWFRVAQETSGQLQDAALRESRCSLCPEGCVVVLLLEVGLGDGTSRWMLIRSVSHGWDKRGSRFRV